MKRFKRKPHTARRPKDRNDHWLGEGDSGKECLFFEIDPLLFAADAIVSRSATLTSRSIERDDQKPAAILVPPPDTIGWQLGMLSRNFRVSVWTASEDELIDEAAYRFQATIFSGELHDFLREPVALILYTDYHWENKSRLLEALIEARQHLAQDGSVCFVFPVIEADGQSLIHFEDGSTLTLTDLAEGRVFTVQPPHTLEHLLLSDFEPRNSEVLSNFLKRHRDYFGRNGRDLLLQRIADPEFSEVFRKTGTPGSPSAGVAVAVWGGELEEKSA